MPALQLKIMSARFYTAGFSKEHRSKELCGTQAFKSMFHLRGWLLHPPFVEFDEIEVGLNIFASAAARLFEKMIKARAFRRGIGVT